jgi:hypothetical protein
MLPIENTIWDISDNIKVNGVEVWNESQTSMNQLLRDIENLGYHAGKKFEKEIEKLLRSKKIKYKAQPNGSQSYPDFHLFFGAKKLDLECKSGTTKKVTWNQGYPRDNGVYAFSTKHKACAGNYLFMGQDHWPKDVKDYFLKEVLPKVKIDQDHHNTVAKSKFGDDLPFTYYCREMWTDRRSPTENSESKKINVYEFCYKELADEFDGNNKELSQDLRPEAQEEAGSILHTRSTEEGGIRLNTDTRWRTNTGKLLWYR